ncbi:MAG: DUF4136 domain-containing protein [Halieaceae bacterium]|jgi:hypothetical protein|nr:DUF4136 domain-containing protein [Halieaceae bacterium]
MTRLSFIAPHALLRLLALCSFALSALGGCSGVETIADDTARFEAARYTRYAWRSEPLEQKAFARDRLSQADPMIRSAVDARLAELGYELVEREEAEFVVEYLASGSINDGRLARTASNVTPYPSGQINRQADGATVDNAYALSGVKEMGNILLVFVERGATNALWRVRISKVMEDANRVNEGAVRRAVREGLSTLPPAR